MPKSVMTGDWTFTSPSVYLAYDTVDVQGQCTTGHKHMNGVLTLHPSELSSMVNLGRKNDPGIDREVTRAFNLLTYLVPYRRGLTLRVSLVNPTAQSPTVRTIQR